MRLSVLLIPVALLAAACGGDPAPAPAPAVPTTTAQFLQQMWDGWSDADRAATCAEYQDYPERTVETFVPTSSGIPVSEVQALLTQVCG